MNTWNPKKNIAKLEEQRRKGDLGRQAQEFQRELDMLYETKTPIQRDEGVRN